ncbi:MAG: hypothetical protein WC708_07480 [Lentisphaeria bacterium]
MFKPEFKLLWVNVLWGVMAAFAALLAGAMLLYPDATGHPGGYPFFHEFISALGMTKTHEGVPNLLPCILFNAGLGAAMLALIPFWIMRAGCLRGGHWTRVPAVLCCCGLSIGITGVALTPYNLHPDLHNFSVYSAFALIVPGILIMLLFAHRDYCGRTYQLGWCAAAAGILLAEGVALVLVRHGQWPARPTNPVIQKINVTVFMLWVAAELVLYRRHLARRQTAPAAAAPPN